MGNKTYTVFSETTGERLRVSSRPKNEGPPPIKAGTVCVEGFLENTKLYVDGKIVDKSASKIILTGTKLKNLPNATEVTITGNGATFRRTITDGIYEFTLDMPGEYMIKCESGIELPIEFKVTIK